jgi:hypothetical protein
MLPRTFECFLLPSLERLIKLFRGVVLVEVGKAPCRARARASVCMQGCPPCLACTEAIERPDNAALPTAVGGRGHVRARMLVRHDGKTRWQGIAHGRGRCQACAHGHARLSRHAHTMSRQYILGHGRGHGRARARGVAPSTRWHGVAHGWGRGPACAHGRMLGCGIGRVVCFLAPLNVSSCRA